MQGIPGPDCILYCETCGALFRRKKWQMRTARPGRFCSRACAFQARGQEANHWGDGSTISTYGYRRIRIDGRYYWEHRLVAERLLGRPLERREKVHHINGDKLDNRPENLRVMDHSEHMRLHQTDPEWARPVREAAHRSSPAKSSAMKRRWADPARRSAMVDAIRRGKGLTPLPADH